MGYALREGLSFCVVDGRILFLDLLQDRYFCLRAEIEPAFFDLCATGELGAADRTRMLSSRLIVDIEGPSAITACRQPPGASLSLAEDAAARAGMLGAMTMLARLAAAPVELRLRGLAGTMKHLKRRKQRLADQPDIEGLDARVRAVAASLQHCARLVSSHDRCLPRSIAVAHRLVSIGARPHLVLGVRLRPFRAHAWVQWRDTLVNERSELARLFTPIFVV